MEPTTSPPTSEGSDSSSEGTTTEDGAPRARAGLKSAIQKEMQCSICLSAALLPHVVVPCGHDFCANCIEEWLRQNSNCPECRCKVIGHPVPSLTLGRISDRVDRGARAVELAIEQELELRKSKAERATATFRDRWAQDLDAAQNGSALGTMFGLGLPQLQTSLRQLDLYTPDMDVNLAALGGPRPLQQLSQLSPSAQTDEATFPPGD